MIIKFFELPRAAQKHYTEVGCAEAMLSAEYVDDTYPNYYRASFPGRVDTWQWDSKGRGWSYESDYASPPTATIVVIPNKETKRAKPAGRPPATKTG
jgi:hypothetical protein